jgi:hypothetical protein
MTQRASSALHSTSRRVLTNRGSGQPSAFAGPRGHGCRGAYVTTKDTYPLTKEYSLTCSGFRDNILADMRNPLPFPAEAYLPDTDRDEPGALPEWFVHFLAMLILFLLEHVHAARLNHSRRLQTWPDDRPDLPAGSTQSEAASIRGPFGRAIAWMCRRHGIGPGHEDWPELSRAIVAFGGSLKGFRAGAPAIGLQWWDNPNIVQGMIPGFGAPEAPASLLEQQAVASAPTAAPKKMQAAHARRPASWLAASASMRQVFARAGPSSSTGPPGCPALPTLSCLTHGAGAWPAPSY